MSFKQWTVCHLSLFITFIVSGLAINALQLGLYLLVGWWNKRLFRKINYYFIWMIYAQILFLADWWSGSEVRFYYDPKSVKIEELNKSSAIVLMNHHFELDWLFGWMVADRLKVLGNGRVFVKKIIKYVPIIGWAWSFSDVAYLARDWEKDQEVMAKSIRSLSEYPDPMWLLLFAEGTRLSPEKLEASRDFARKRGLPVLRHCLTPRTKGFTHVLQNVDESKVPNLYDVTIAVHPRDGGPATMSSILTGRKTVAEVYIKKYDLKSIPKDAENSSKFLMDVYAQKDQLIDNYALSGQFTDGPVNCTILPRRPYALINTIVLNLMVVPFVFGQIGVFAFSGSMLHFGLALTLVIILYFTLKKFIGLTKISKGSSYGKKTD